MVLHQLLPSAFVLYHTLSQDILMFLLLYSRGYKTYISWWMHRDRARVYAAIQSERSEEE
jgi:hypothetical protein